MLLQCLFLVGKVSGRIPGDDDKKARSLGLLAQALEYAGMPIDPGDVITANELFVEVSKFAVILKYEEDD